jgi:hypothetical protein
LEVGRRGGDFGWQGLFLAVQIKALRPRLCRPAGWSLANPRRPSGGGASERLDQVLGLAVVFALPVGEGFFGVAPGTLQFKQKDGGGTHEGEIARGDGLAHQAMIFPLGVVAAVVCRR